MIKRVFFSFHYEDVSNFRANTVRNHWVTKPDRKAARFFDASIWETAKKTGDIALKRLINGRLRNTSNTCVLIGSDTYKRRWVRYEIFKSMERGNYIFTVHINKIRDKDKKIKAYGLNPLEQLGVKISPDGKHISLFEYRFGKWVKARDFKDNYKLKTNLPKYRWGKFYKLSELYKTYCWKKHEGYNNFYKWVK